MVGLNYKYVHTCNGLIMYIHLVLWMNIINMVAPNSTLVFKARRSEPDLVRPAQPTPNEVKSLSCDDQRVLNRHQMSCILFYQATTDMKDRDPAKVLKTALEEALVPYYPWAGRLKEAPDASGGSVVDCTAEGVGFVEADADVRLDDFGEESLQSPFPCIQELLYYKASNRTETIGCPIFAMQVTRLLCGGFILTFTFSHAMSDLKGVCQFVTAITDLARRATTPSVQPIWQRELLNARDDPPRVTCPAGIDKFILKAKPVDVPQAKPIDSKTLTHRSFFFGPQELDALRSRIPDHHLRSSCSAFALITASVFRSRTIALQSRPEEEARLFFVVDARRQFDLPNGYYGNVCTVATFVCPAEQVCAVGSLGYLVERVKRAKAEVTEEYARSIWDLHDRPPDSIPLDLVCSDWTRAGMSSLDFGWGKPVFAGNVHNGLNPLHLSFMVPFRDGRLLSLSLPVDAVDKFSTALHTLIHDEHPTNRLN